MVYAIYLFMQMFIYVAIFPGSNWSDAIQYIELENDNPNTLEDKEWEKRGSWKRDCWGTERDQSASIRTMSVDTMYKYLNKQGLKYGREHEGEAHLN